METLDPEIQQKLDKIKSEHKPKHPSAWNTIFSFKGRVGRRSFFAAIFVLGAYFQIIALWTKQTHLNQLAQAIISLFTIILLISELSFFVRRLHDIRLSGWWSLLILVPFVNLGVMIYLLFRPGLPEVINSAKTPTKNTKNLL